MEKFVKLEMSLVPERLMSNNSGNFDDFGLKAMKGYAKLFVNILLKIPNQSFFLV